MSQLDLLTVIAPIATAILATIALWLKPFVGRLESVFYLKYIYPRNMENAYLKEDLRLVESAQYQAKLVQLGSPRYESRRLAVAYFENVPPTHELAEKLLRSVPLQHNRDIQIEMTRLLLSTLETLKEQEQGLDTAIQRWERSEISREQMETAQQWHSWQKWVHQKNELGWKEMEQHSLNGLTPAMLSIVEAELERVQRESILSGEQTEEEKEYERRLHQLVAASNRAKSAGGRREARDTQ